MITKEKLIDAFLEMFEEYQKMYQSEYYGSVPELPYSICENKEMMMKIIDFNAEYYSQVCGDLKKDKELFHKAILKNPDYILVGNKESFNDKELALKLLEEDIKIYKYFNFNLQKDKDIIEYLKSKNVNPIKMMSDEVKESYINI